MTSSGSGHLTAERSIWPPAVRKGVRQIWAAAVREGVRGILKLTRYGRKLLRKDLGRYGQLLCGRELRKYSSKGDIRDKDV